ncbi:MAG: hypothetical protein AABX23_03015 [Nanoarchaeota archaeon]
MSGDSYFLDCGRCGGKDTICSSVETKPFEYCSADCLKCGFSYFTKILILKKDELEELRKQTNYKSRNLTKQEQDSCIDFDNVYLK